MKEERFYKVTEYKNNTKYSYILTGKQFLDKFEFVFTSKRLVQLMREKVGVKIIIPRKYTSLKDSSPENILDNFDKISIKRIPENKFLSEEKGR